MACAGENSVPAAFELVRKAGPMAELTRADFDACLAFLAGELGAPAGAFEPEPGATPRWTAPRVWKRAGWFGVRNRRVARWVRSNVGTICSEESVRVLEPGVAVGAFELEPEAATVVIELFEAQEQWSEVPGAEGLLVEESPAPEGPGRVYTFHAPLHRAACEALARAIGARLGRRFGRNLVLGIADLGWSIRLADDDTLAP